MRTADIEKYAERETLKGLSHQEIFNDLVLKTDLKVTRIAEIMRKVPSLAKRKKNQSSHYVILCLIGISLLVEAYFTFNDIMSSENLFVLLGLLPLGMLALLLYGLFKYRRNAHLVAAVFILLISLVPLARLLSGWVNILNIIDLASLVFAIGLAFFLDHQLSTDYTYHRELAEKNPEARIDTVTFEE